jgi:O-antigen ligase
MALIWGLLTQLSLTLLADSETSLDGRAVIWGYGASAFPEDPVLGQGYGGWETLFPIYANSHGIGGLLPPHNLVLDSWSKTGGIGVLLTLLILAAMLRLAYRAIRASADFGEFQFSIFAGCACVWLVIQSMGENADFFGEVHFIPIVAALLAQLGVIAGREYGDGVSPQGSSLQAPTLHALGAVHS